MADLTMEMPKYRSHKIVRALKIGDGPIETLDNGMKRVPIAVDGWATYDVDPVAFMRHEPQPGDYLVFYEDDYISVSPKTAFEEGYDRIEA